MNYLKEVKDNINKEVCKRTGAQMQSENNDRILISQGLEGYSDDVKWNDKTKALTICVGGYCIVKSIKEWWKLAAETTTFPIKEKE